MLPVLSQSEADLTTCFQQDISALLDSFSEKDTSSKRSLQQMLSSDQAAFSRASIRVLATAMGSPGARYVLHLLRKHNLLTEALADPGGSRREDAIAATRVISQIGAPIALKGVAGLEDFQGLCLASEGGTFAALLPEDVPDEVERLYAQSVNRFEVTYRAPQQAARTGSIQITSTSGCGRAKFLFSGE